MAVIDPDRPVSAKPTTIRNPRLAAIKDPISSDNVLPSSSPAFGTPPPPLERPRNPPLPPNFKPPTVLPIVLPPGTLRPLAFRTFTKKHNLTVSTAALVALAAFIGRHCGAGWRDDGLAEGVLEETARMWKKQNSSPIVDGEGNMLKSILKTVESCMSGGKVVSAKGLSRQNSFAVSGDAMETEPTLAMRPALRTSDSFGMSQLDIERGDNEEDALKDPREWIKVVDAFEQPMMVYNTAKKHFDRSKSKPSLFPPPSHKTEFFRQRYHVVHQRILRNEGFDQEPMAGTARTNHPGDGSAANKITPISNLLGRTNTPHLLLGLLIVLPTGVLGLSDLTGSIALDIQHARPFPDPSAAWFCPGMMVLADGVYIEDGTGSSESALGSTGGIGATIGGKFVASVVAHPPCERRAISLGIQEGPDAPTGPAFGWTDFLGNGSERATGARMRRLQSRILDPSGTGSSSRKIAIAAELHLDDPNALTSLRILLTHYDSLPAAETPLSLILLGNFTRTPALSGARSAAGLDYKEAFNSLAALLSDFPQLLAHTTLVFVPGDRDAWPSAFAAGAAVPLPRRPVPEMFTTRVRRVVAEANREVRGGTGSVVWASNPARLSWFGCAGEMVVLRDDVSGRLRRSAVRFPSVSGEDEGDDAAATEDAMQVDPAAAPAEAGATAAEPLDPDLLAARRLTKTLLDQAHLVPFPLSTRPVLWDYGSALSLYPLPTALVVADPDAPTFALNYMGCCVMNPGRLVEGRRGELASWVEFDVVARKGEVLVKGEAG